MNTVARLVTLAFASLGLLLACGGDAGNEPPRGMTVRGLVQNLHGVPVSGTAVLVSGRSPVTSGSDGRFFIPGVEAPYDITLLLASRNTAVVYKGLTRPDPTLVFLDTGATKTVTISGTTPPAPGKITIVFFVSGRVWGSSPVSATTGQYAMTFSSHGSAPTYTGQLYLLRAATWFPTGLPATYDAYGSKPLTIGDEGTFSGNDFAETDLTDPPEQTIDGSVFVPAGYTIKYRALAMTFGSLHLLVASDQGTLSNPFTYAVPGVGGMTFGVYAEADEGFPNGRWSAFIRNGITGNATDVTVPLEAATQLALPENDAAGVDGTTPFSWSAGGGTGVNLFAVVPRDPSHPTFFVFTTGSDAKIPDLATQGMGLPATAAYWWYTNKSFPVASMDDAAGEGFLELINWDAAEAGRTRSGVFAFTSKAVAGVALRGSAAEPTTPVLPSLQPRGWLLQPRAISTDAR